MVMAMEMNFIKKKKTGRVILFNVVTSLFNFFNQSKPTLDSNA